MFGKQAPLDIGVESDALLTHPMRGENIATDTGFSAMVHTSGRGDKPRGVGTSAFTDDEVDEAFGAVKSPSHARTPFGLRVSSRMMSQVSLDKVHTTASSSTTQGAMLSRRMLVQVEGAVRQSFTAALMPLPTPVSADRPIVADLNKSTLMQFAARVARQGNLEIMKILLGEHRVFNEAQRRALVENAWETEKKLIKVGIHCAFIDNRITFLRSVAAGTSVYEDVATLHTALAAEDKILLHALPEDFVKRSLEYRYSEAEIEKRLAWFNKALNKYYEKEAQLFLSFLEQIAKGEEPVALGERYADIAEGASALQLAEQLLPLLVIDLEAEYSKSQEMSALRAIEFGKQEEQIRYIGEYWQMIDMAGKICKNLKIIPAAGKGRVTEDDIHPLFNEPRSVCEPDPSGRTLMHYAAEGGHIEMLKLLTARLNQNEISAVLKLKDNKGRTVRDIAFAQGYYNCLVFLESISSHPLSFCVNEAYRKLKVIDEMKRVVVLYHDQLLLESESMPLSIKEQRLRWVAQLKHALKQLDVEDMRETIFDPELIKMGVSEKSEARLNKVIQNVSTYIVQLSSLVEKIQLMRAELIGGSEVSLVGALLGRDAARTLSQWARSCGTWFGLRLEESRLLDPLTSVLHKHALDSATGLMKLQRILSVAQDSHQKHLPTLLTSTQAKVALKSQIEVLTRKHRNLQQAAVARAETAEQQVRDSQEKFEKLRREFICEVGGLQDELRTMRRERNDARTRLEALEKSHVIMTAQLQEAVANKAQFEQQLRAIEAKDVAGAGAMPQLFRTTQVLSLVGRGDKPSTSSLAL